MQLEEDLSQELQGFKDLISVAQVVVSSLQLDEVLLDILTSAMAIMDMPAGSVALYEESSGEMIIHAHAGLSQNFVANDRWAIRPGGLTEQSIQLSEPLIYEDLQKAPERNPLLIDEGIRSLVAVPLKIQEHLLGMLYLDDFGPRSFSRRRLRLLSILSSFAAMSIDNARLHEEMRRLACTDGLTGLYNYRQFGKLLGEILAEARRYRRPLSLIMFDLDDFKKFNDTYGHPQGDKALTIVAGILRDSLRGSDKLFRYGGEEFIAILPQTASEEALIGAERARSAVESQSRPKLQEIADQGLTVSVGVATYPADGGTAEELLRIVDQLLYQAKREGKNKVYHRAPSGAESPG